MAHLNIEDRQKIEELLNENKNFTDIGRTLDKDRTCIRKEIKNHIEVTKKSDYGINIIKCANSKDCKNYHGKFCKKKCNDYIEVKCEKLLKAPYVCNGCEKKKYCKLERHYYRYINAQKEYKKELTDSRSGIRISPQEVKTINEVIAPLFKSQKHSVHQVYVNNPDELTFSKTTFYKYTDMGIFEFRNIDLPRRVRYKKDSSSKRTRKESLVRLNRTYKDYIAYLEANNDREVSVVQMDTVEGLKGGKVFLTLLFENYNLMLIYILDSKTKEEVKKVFDKLKHDLGEKEFCRLFEVILTDNGSEFFGADDIECNENSVKLISLFYCDPSASYQKGGIEKNHEYIRCYLPKPSSFDHLTQTQVTLMMNHINNIPRESLRNLTPYESSNNFISKEIKSILYLYYIKPNDVNLNSDLLKKS